MGRKAIAMPFGKLALPSAKSWVSVASMILRDWSLCRFDAFSLALPTH